VREIVRPTLDWAQVMWAAARALSPFRELRSQLSGFIVFDALKVLAQVPKYYNHQACGAARPGISPMCRTS